MSSKILDEFFENLEPPQKNDPRKEWVGMPEFVQEKQEPFAKIIFRFETKEDLDEFAEIIGQKLTPNTKSAWHPYRSHFRDVQKEWTDKKNAS